MANRDIRVEIDITANDNASSAVDGVKSSLNDLQSTMESVQKSFAGLGSTSSYKSPFEKYSRSTSQFSKQLGSTKLEKAITVHDGVTSGIKSILSGAKSLVSKPIEIAAKIASPVTSVVKSLASPLAAAGLSLGAGAAVSDVVSTYAGFEAEMSKVKAISGATGSEFEALTKKAKEMGAQTKFTSEEAGQAFEYMAMAGWKPQQMMSGINGIMRLAAAAGEDLGTTSDIVTDAVTAFGHSATDTLSDGTNYVDHFVDVLAKASSSSNTNVSMMGESFKYAAPLAGALGFTVDDTARAIGLMANQGIKASQAGTAMRGWLTRMSKPTKDSQAAMDKLGLSLTDSEGKMKSLGTIMDETRAGFAKLSEVEKTSTAAQLAGQYGMTGLLAIVNASEQDYNALTSAIQNSSGAATDMSNTMLDNVQGKWTLFTSALDVMKNNLGERIKPYLMDAIQWMTDHVPDLQSALESAMDKVDEFAGKIRQGWNNLEMNSDFQSADIFGKIKIVLGKAFDGIHDFIASRAQGFGKKIGTGLHNGILALLGIDVTGAVNEGQSIGAQFAKGFSEGFSTGDITKALFGKIGTLFSNAGQLFTGSGNISSLLSAILIAKVGSNLLGGGLKLAKFGVDTKKVLAGLWGSYGTAAAAEAASPAAAAAAQGTGAASLAGTGIAGLLGKIGTAAGATSAGGAVALGGAVIGGAAGTALGVGTGIYDTVQAVKASKEGDEEKKKAYGTAATARLGGVGMGALLGTAIMPGVGTLIGAGIGGAVGYFAGKKTIDDYNEAVDRQTNYQEKAKYALQGTTFASKELADQFNDTEISAETFGASLQQAINDKNAEAFGKMTLSASELKDAVKNIMFTSEQTKRLTAYQEAADTASSSLETLESAQKNLDKMNWKAGVGSGFSDQEDIDSYKAAIDSYSEATKQYLTDQHYASTQAANLLVDQTGPKVGAAELNSQTDAVYIRLQNQLDSANKEVTAKYNIALEDGTITSDEASAIQKAQEKVREITDKVNQSQIEAGQEELKARFSGAALNSQTYGQMLTEMQSQGKESAESYKEAFLTEAQTLSLARNTLDESGNPLISEDKYRESMQSLRKGYQEQLSGLKNNFRDFGLQSIADAFQDQGVNLNTSALTQSMEKALTSDIDFAKLNLPDAQKLFGLDKLKIPEETKDAIAQDLTQLAVGIQQMLSDSDLGDTFKTMFEGWEQEAQKASDTLANPGNLTDFQRKRQEAAAERGLSGSAIEQNASEKAQNYVSGTVDQTAAAISNADTSKIEDAASAKASEAQSAASTAIAGTSAAGTVSENANGLTQSVEEALTSAIEEMDVTEVGSKIQTKLGEALTAGMAAGEGAGGKADLSGIAAGLQESLTGAIEGMDFTEIGTSLQEKIGEAMTGGGFAALSGGGDASGIAAGIQASVTLAVTNIDLSEAGAALQTKIGEALSAAGAGGEGGGDMSGIAAGIQSAITSSMENLDLSGAGAALEAQITAAFGALVFDFSSVGTGIGASLGSAIAGATGWEGGVASLYSAVGAAISSQFAAGYSVTTTVSVTINWQITNPTAGISTSASGTSVRASIAGSANGRFIDRAMLSMIGEDGPEYVIPVGAKRRGRGLDLWEQAGRDLGVPGFADGGLAGGTPDGGSFSSLFGSEDDGLSPVIPAAVTPAVSDGAQGAPASIVVNSSPTVTVNGAMSREEILEQVRGQLYGFSDNIIEDLAEKLADVFGSMPTNASPI